MKKIILLFLGIALLSSCELDMLPESEKTYNGFWDSEGAVKAAHTGIMASYRGYAYTLWQMGELRSDIWGGNTIESPYGTDLIQNNISTTIVHFNNWAGFYSLIHYLNDFIKNAPAVPFKNEAELNHLMGQVYGIRAQIYYTMLKAWGEVPVATEPLLNVDLVKLKKKRSPKTEVMQLIKDDIAKSLEYFGDDYSFWLNKKVYWSKAATLALKGDVYLWSGKVLEGGDADFTEARSALGQVTGFTLVPYASLWGQSNESNNEFIFAFDYQKDQAENFYSNFTGRAVDVGPLFDDAGNSMTAFTVNGASRFGPTDKTLLMLDDVNDHRRKTFIRLYTDAAGHIPYSAGSPAYKGSILNKFVGVVDANQRRSWNNIPLYRYADVVLMLAEAKNNLGEDPSDEINLVRQRAYGTNYDPLIHGFANSTPLDNAKAILDERFKEFAGEGKRWWDLVRAGGTFVFDEVVAINPDEAYKIYYSISPAMIADDPELEQTDGYEQP